MPLRTLVLLLVALLAVAGCGGDGVAGSDTPVDELLRDTFSGEKAIESGRLDLSVSLLAGSGRRVTLDVAGPFQSQGAGRLPQLDVDASLSSGGPSIEAGVVATADRAFVRYGADTFELAAPVFLRLKAAYEEAAKRSSGGQGQSLASLGIDPRRWLTNAENAGEAKVGETDTVKITGDADVPALLEDVDRALERIRALGLQGSGRLPERLTDAQKRQARDAIERLDVEIHTGAEDRILRRMVVGLGLDAPGASSRGGAQTLDLRFDLQLLEVNEDQEIEAPERAKSFEELMARLKELGLGDFGVPGGGVAPGSGAGGAREKLERYSRCVQEAAGDSAKVRRCADVVATP